MVETEEERLVGVVAKYFPHGGYGFIAVEGSDIEYFYHMRNFEDNITNINLGRKVSFIPLMTDKGLQAVQCKILD